MNDQPKNMEQDDAAMKAVMGIFEAGASQEMPLRTRIEAADALARAGDPRLDRDEENWILIPAGDFWMGAQKHDPEGRNYDPEAWEIRGHSDEAPVHLVSLRAFRIRRYPVTVQEFARFVDAGAYSEVCYWGTGGFGEFQEPEGWQQQRETPSRPVVGVSWYEASAYATWAGARLPTEAEWERAARGPQSSRFPWGDLPPLDGQRANYDSGSDAPSAPTPVGLYPLGNSVEGVSDLLGNVHEWTADWYDARYYEGSPSRDPAGPSSGLGKVLRGGCWDYGRGSVRVSVRDWYEPTIRYSEVGFRCAGEFR